MPDEIMQRDPAQADAPADSSEPQTAKLQPAEPKQKRSHIHAIEVVLVTVLCGFGVLMLIFVIWNLAKFLRF